VKHLAIALTPAVQDLLLQSASDPWVHVHVPGDRRRNRLQARATASLAVFRYCGRLAIIARSLTQTRDVLEFKGTKTEKPNHYFCRPRPSAVWKRTGRCNEFRRQYEAEYRNTALTGI